MQEPCRSCNRKDIDFGGCRCQAMQVLGDPNATDPPCYISPHHNALLELAEAAPNRSTDAVYRILSTAPAASGSHSSRFIPAE